MALPGFRSNRKFKRLLAILRIPEAHALGHMQMIWESCYDKADPALGDSLDVELAAGWVGEPGVLTEALASCGGDGPGLIEAVGEDGQFTVHDFWHHAPRYVQERAKKNAAREEAGDSISSIRARAGKLGAERKWTKDGKRMANGKPLPSKNGNLPSTCEDKMANCHQSFPVLSSPFQSNPEQEQEQRVCTEPDKPALVLDASPVIYQVPCKGLGPKAWPLTQAKMDEWAEAFPGVDLKSELRKSIQWLKDNPTKGKTARGMPAYFGRWLSNAQDRNPGTGATSGTNQRHRFSQRDEALRKQLAEQPRHHPQPISDEEVDEVFGVRR